MRSLDLLRRVKETERISIQCMLQLYKALVSPQLEYAVPVWQNGNCTALEKVQRKGLAMCLGIPGTAGLDALEVEAGIQPLDIRRDELATRQAAKIMTNDDSVDSSLIRASWDKFLDQDRAERKISTFGKMNIQVADTLSNTDLCLLNLEKEPNYVCFPLPPGMPSV